MRAGDLVEVDFGVPAGSEPGFVRPAIVITADPVLAYAPRTIHVVPLTRNIQRRLPTEVQLEGPGSSDSAAQCHLCSVISTSRIGTDDLGNVGPVTLAQIRSVLADLLDL